MSDLNPFIYQAKYMMMMYIYYKYIANLFFLLFDIQQCHNGVRWLTPTALAIKLGNSTFDVKE